MQTRRSGEIATVRWGLPSSPAALYGSALLIDPAARAGAGELRLVNPLMPSGTILQEWHSSTDYRALRHSPTLPLLHPGRSYRLDPELRSDPPDTVLFELRCYDRFDRLLGAEVLRPPEHRFETPAACHHYTIRLVNAGCDELRFTSFTLREEDADEQQ